MQKLYSNHISSVKSGLDRHLGELGLSSLIIDAGNLEYFFADDQSKVFRPTPLFNYFVPLDSHGHQIQYTPGQKPRLLYFQPEDFWYDVQPPEESFWNEHFTIEIYSSIDEIWKNLKTSTATAYIGPQTDRATALGLQCNPEKLVNRLDWQRSFKTSYEVACLDKAEERAALGHIAAESCFHEGGSEIEIHLAYMRALQTIEADLPYWSIVGLDRNGAILHYESKRTRRGGKSMLIDSGARFNHYCSDITRTYFRPDAHPVFQEVVRRTDDCQQQLCTSIVPGMPYPDLHHMANVEIYKILHDLHIIRDIDCDSAIQEEVVKTFFPHGLGHMLGLQVHDVGGYLANENGETAPPPERYPKLRTTRKLEKGVVLTVEPGIYFIPLLLDKMRNSTKSKFFNWDLIDQLIPFGGVRIEDNVLVQETMVRNLTRPYLP